MKNTTKKWMGIALMLGVTPDLAQANQLVVTPFSQTALTEGQIQAWEYYLADESSQYGCQYGDDVRLQEDPRGVLEALANREDMEPLQITLRTFLFAEPNVQQLLQHNMYIASMECNPVYYFDGDLIGHPVLPYEEYLDIFFNKLKQQGSIRAHLDFLRGTKIAAMDARWFWAFFVLDRDHHRLLGRDADIVTGLAASLPGDLGDITPTNSYWQVYSKVFGQGIYVEDTNSCDGEIAEPNIDVVVDESIQWETVAAFYEEEGIAYRGKWRAVVQQDEEGYTLADSTAIDEPVNPYFNVKRRVTIRPEECN